MSAQSLKVLIVAGGLTHERDVSVRSGRRVANSLVNQGFAAKVVDLIKTFPRQFRIFSPMLFGRLCMAPSVKMGPCKPCLREPEFLTLVQRLPRRCSHRISPLRRPWLAPQGLIPRVDCASPASVPPAWCTECPEDD